MKTNILSSTLQVILALSACTAHAQVNTQPDPAKANGGTKSRVVLTLTGDGAAVQNANSQVKLTRLETAKIALETELALVTGLMSKSPSFCDQEKLRLRLEDAQFLKKNADQIADIIGSVRKGLKYQLGLIRNFQNGLTEGYEAEDYTNADGQPDKSVMMEIKDFSESDATKTKKIAVKDLMKFIAKYEKDAKVLDEAALEAKYSDALNERKPEFFFMTLSQATSAYQNQLNSVFRRSNREEQSRNFVLGSGKNLFRLTTTTTLGWNGKYSTTVGTQLRKTNEVNPKLSINLVQNFSEALEQAAEDKYWEVLRNQQLTIDGIPVDGYLRRVYFDAMRSVECQEREAFTFNEKSVPGPFQSYEDKDPCTKSGMELLTASVTKTHDWGGGRGVRVGAVFDITAAIGGEANYKKRVSSADGFRRIITSLGMGNCDDVEFEATYRCGCSRRVIPFKVKYKLGGTISFGC